MPHNRRGFLRATALGATATLVGTGAGVASAEHVQEVVSITDPVPENIAFVWNGDLYVGITGGSVRRLPADRTGETGLGGDPTDPGPAFVCNFSNANPDRGGALRSRL